MALTKTPIELSSTPSIVDGGNATAITIDSSENVGIGTSSPFSINGTNLEVSDALYARVILDSTAGTRYSIQSLNDSSLTIYDIDADAERMRIDASGKLLVGGTVAGYSGTDITCGSTTQDYSGLSILTNTTGVGYLLFGDASGDATGGYRGQVTYNHNAGDMSFVVEGLTRFSINLSGHPFFPYIRASAGSYTAKITSGSAELTFDTSSARYKDNIRDSTYGLSAAMQLQSRMFEYKEDDQRTDVGFIAEEVNEVIPELVVIDGEGRPDAVNYDRMTSVLLKAIQEQQATIEALTQRIETLENN